MRTQVLQTGRTVRLATVCLPVVIQPNFYDSQMAENDGILNTIRSFTQNCVHVDSCTYFAPFLFNMHLLFVFVSWSIKLTSLNKLKQISSHPTHEMSPVFLLCVQQCYWTDLVAGCVLYHMGVCPCYHGSTLRLRIPRTSHLFSNETAISNPNIYIKTAFRTEAYP